MASGHVIIIHPDNRVSVEDTLEGEPRLGQLQKAVEGYVEVVPLFESIDVSPTLLTYSAEEDVRRLIPLREGPQTCIVFCNEDGKAEDRPLNMLATQLWGQALLRDGHATALPQGGIAMRDILVGPVAILIGDRAIAQEREA